MNIDVNVDLKDPVGLTKALSRFKKALKQSGLMEELRERESYSTPSQARKDKRKKAVKQRVRDAKKSERKR